MSRSRMSAGDADGKAPKRNLPSWMISTSRDDGDKPEGNKPGNDCLYEDCQESAGRKRAKGNKNNAEEIGSPNDSSAVGASHTDFSRIMEGVVFVLSGFVNPERSILRSQGLEMGAEYQPDWNSNCTLLVCAFHNTPKFRQVEAECGTIVSKEWITECYAQKKLVDIDSYLMHAGKPWKKGNISQNVKDKELTSPRKTPKQEDRLSQVKLDALMPSKASKDESSKSMVEDFSPSKVKKWAINDLNRTMLWLESQEEKPEPSDMKKVAVEGILTCLQDAINLLDKKEDMQQLAEQWNILPQVVQELVKGESNARGSGSIFKEDLHQEAAACKKIYEQELNRILGESDTENKDVKTRPAHKKAEDRKGKAKQGATGYDSDETIEMTEEEIDDAFKTIASKIYNS